LTEHRPELTWPEVVAAIGGLDAQAVSSERWFGGKGRAIVRIEPLEAFDLKGSGLAIVEVSTGQKPGAGVRYLVPLTRVEAGEVRPAAQGEGAWRALALAIAEGRTIPALRRARPAGDAPAPVQAALVCRPAAGLRALSRDLGPVGTLDERRLDADQSNTSVVLGDRLLLKAYRRVEDGLNPDLELNAFLAEEVGFPAVPALAGYAEVVTARGAATVALLQEYVADATDAYEAIAEQLTDWIVAPGAVAVEFASEVAVDMGALTAALHAALASAPDVPGFEVRDATRDELRDWRRDAHRQLQHAIDLVDGAPGDELRAMAPAIAEQLTVLEAVAAVPVVTRVHADLHLGQVLLTPDGPRIVDFEGEPTRPIEERRRPTSPLRDVASMLRSIDHVGRSARRRAERRTGGPVESPGLDIEAWLTRARERFLEAYRTGLRASGAAIVVDEDLLRAFEFEKESYEFVYAATWLPDWIWAPLEGMRALVAESGAG
jgi:trehalose synthase-fused probable maltokinase